MLNQTLSHQVVLASSNRGKLLEIQQLLQNSSIQIIPQSEFNVPEVDETGLTFIENALLKARKASEISNLPAIADDSGLMVDALNGQPGIYSARFAGKDASDEKNLEKLLIAINSIPESQRTARFYCAMVFLMQSNDPLPLCSNGVWEGRILLEKKGHNGFGYDPVFYVPTHKCSAAELQSEVKNEISHRGQALRGLVSKIKASKIYNS